MSEWQRPSGCSSNECIEVRFGTKAVSIRNSALDPELSQIHASLEDWAVFVAAVKAGEYD